MENYNILLYYCYTHIANPELFREEHHLFCLSLDLKGRIIIASEGINGTISGTVSNCKVYMDTLKRDLRFASIDFKVEPFHQHSFKKLNVRVKPEIVHSGLMEVDPTKRTGTYLEPSEFKKLKEQEDVVILDVRSHYEHKIGKFRNAITLDLENFRDFPERIRELELLKKKKVVTYCTGGIKCEKASAFLLQQGFENVYQLHGGIIKYSIEEGGEGFDGKCYVFDNRIIADVNKVDPLVISYCHLCAKEEDRMINCSNPKCNLHVPICENCGWELLGACSKECKQHPERRPYDGSGNYQKQLNGYNPYKGVYRKEKTV